MYRNHKCTLAQRTWSSVNYKVIMETASFVCAFCVSQSWFIPNLQNTWHFCRVQVLSFGSVCASFYQLTSTEKCPPTSKKHGMFASVPVVASVLDWNAFSLQLTHARVWLDPDWAPHTDGLGLVILVCMSAIAVFSWTTTKWKMHQGSIQMACVKAPWVTKYTRPSNKKSLP